MDNIVDSVTDKEVPMLSDSETMQAAYETFDPAASVESFTVAGRTFPLTFIPWKPERRMLEIIAPYCKLLVDSAALGQLEGTIQQVLMEAPKDLHTVAVIILTHHLKNDPAFAPLVATEETSFKSTEARISDWLDENARFEEIADMVLRQVNKNKVADSLGKLWAPSALALKTLRVLNTLPLHIIQLLESNSGALQADSE